MFQAILYMLFILSLLISTIALYDRIYDSYFREFRELKLFVQDYTASIQKSLFLHLSRKKKVLSAILPCCEVENI
jgi:hypothetical protein